jgi:hypothetical protein
MRNVVVIYPSNPKGVKLQMNVPELLGKETIIFGFDVKDRQTPFIFLVNTPASKQQEQIYFLAHL